MGWNSMPQQQPLIEEKKILKHRYCTEDDEKVQRNWPLVCRDGKITKVWSVITTFNNGPFPWHTPYRFVKQDLVSRYGSFSFSFGVPDGALSENKKWFCFQRSISHMETWMCIHFVASPIPLQTINPTVNKQNYHYSQVHIIQMWQNKSRVQEKKTTHQG